MPDEAKADYSKEFILNPVLDEIDFKRSYLKVLVEIAYNLNGIRDELKRLE